jgi:hypothetical protein
LSLLIATIVDADATGLEPTKPSQIVMVGQSGALCPFGGGAIDILLGGDGSYAPFVIPAKKVLIITGFDWSAINGPAGSQVLAVLSTQIANPPAENIPVVDLTTSTTTFASNGKASKNELTTPLVVRPGRTLCLFVTAGLFNAATVQGFIAPDR